jgi:hypothetical protein
VTVRGYVVVEGRTEEAVVRNVLVPHLATMGVYLFPIVVRTSPGHKGGGSHWAKWENDIRRLLKQHRGPDVRVTTMFDLFRLPKGFPGLQEHGGNPDSRRRCDALQTAMAEVFEDRRFIPYIQRHELEALVLASLHSLPGLFDAQEDLDGIQALIEEIGLQPPEDVDDGPDTAPSRRLERRIPSYRKALHGPMAIEDTGLAAVRAACPGSDEWITTLESLPGELGR